MVSISSTRVAGSARSTGHGRQTGMTLDRSDPAAQFSRQAEAYAASATHAKDADLDIIEALADCRPGDLCLDVATGPGTLALRVAQRAAQVCAIDFSAGMIEQLRGRTPFDLRGKLEVRQADGQDLPFEDASFDIAFSMFGLFMFPDRARGFAELGRILRKCGSNAEQR